MQPSINDTSDNGMRIKIRHTNRPTYGNNGRTTAQTALHLHPRQFTTVQSLQVLMTYPGIIQMPDLCGYALEIAALQAHNTSLHNVLSL